MIYNRDYNYEISIWTLQDSFITVLKNSNLEQEGWLQDGSIEINVDGTQNLSFSIPMYIYQDGIQQENPIWYNTANGNLIANMRKIKVIINKNNPEEKVYEFLITKVIERHETDQLYCDVEGEGLAFHELGKIGYKISLASENLSLIDLDSTELPHNNLQYWLKEASIDEYNEDLDSSTWGYEIKIEQLNGQTSDIIYEDDYLTWGIENDYLISTGNSGIEKYRPVDIEESNIYNITQKLAEIFGVFCRYEYEYDDNFHIQHRKIIFYNNFLQEKEGYIDLTYPYNTNSIKRNIDSTDLITKMYVRPVNAGTNSDMVTIMNTPANKGLEDYILNFDYLYSIGTITKEQYEAIDIYKEDLHKLNNSIDDLSIKINAIEAQLPNLEATITTLNNSIQLDKNGSEPINNLTDSLTNGTGVIEITADNPEIAVLLDEENATGRYYIKLKQVGIIPGTIRVYKNWSTNNNKKVLSGLLDGGLLEYDEFGGITEIHNLLWESDNLNAPKIVYLTYNYDPSVYYGKVSGYWTKKQIQDQDNLDKAINKLNDYNEKLEKETESGDKVGYKIDLAKKIDEKNERIKSFNKLMGPAIREGYWQPEDYNDYGKVYHDIYMGIKNNNIAWGIDNSRKSAFEWSVSFDDEEQISYKIGIEEDSKNYLAVDLSHIENKTKENITNLNFIFHTADGNKNLRCFPIGSECQLCYLYTSNKELKPILLLTGAKNLTDSECEILKNSRIYIANLKFNETTKINEYDRTTGQEIDSDDLLTLNWNDKIYYPRIRIDDLNLKLDSDQLLIKYNDAILEQYKDYYITFKANEEGADSPYSYYITIKPEILIKDTSNKSELDIKFVLSTAADYIYLDAVQILKENAYPKVSYEISPSVINDKYLGKTYTMLNRIVNINDVKLKFENVQGYVSKVNLVLDKPWEDKIEIKNYKNKFEDLFSTIVAQTEEMKKNGNLISSLSGIFSNGGLSSGVLEKTIYNNKTILQTYLDAGFDDSSVIENKLTEVFNAAGEILKGASNSTSTISALNTKNAKILSGFAINVQENLTPNITYGIKPPDDFKEGDIWIQQDSEEKEIARYVCTTSRSNIKNYNPNKDSNFYDGWTKTFDGSLAQITGTGIQIDAEQGTIDLLAHNQINLKSGDNIYIGANSNVDIVGNKAVNIGGTQINIGSAVINGKEETGGINLVATSYDTENFIDPSDSPNSSISKVLINPSKIEMASADIEMAAGNGITMYASNDKQQTALKINKDEGIWMGSTQGINFFSGNPMENWNEEYTYSEDEIIYYKGKYYQSLEDNNESQNPTDSNSSYWKEITPNEAGASMSINSDKILFGVVDSNEGTAVEMTKEHIILGASASDYNTLTEEQFTIGTKNDIVASGVKITQNSIGFSTGQNENRSTFLIDQAGLILAAGDTTDISTTTHTGSYVQIKPDGIDLGANGNLYINTANVQLQTNSNAAIGKTNTQPGTLFALGTNLNENDRDPRLVLDGEGNLSIKGNITATSLTIMDSSGNNKSFNKYITGLEEQIDNKIQTWFGKGKPLYNGTSTATGALEHNIVVETIDGKTVQYYEKQKDDNNEYQVGDIVYRDEYGYYERLATQTSSTGSYWQILSIKKLDPTGKDNTRAYWNSYDNDKHIGDIYYDIAETREQATSNNRRNYSETAGQAFRFIKNNDTYEWQLIEGTVTASTAERMEKIRNGEVGLAFQDSGDNSFITLNKTDGLIIMGENQGTQQEPLYPFFKVTNNAMGFFRNSSLTSEIKDTTDSLLYFEGGNLLIAGTLYADKIKIKSTDNVYNGLTLQEYIESFSLSMKETVEDNLKEIFKEAGTIIQNAGASLTDLNTINIENTAILSDFINSAKNLQPTYFTTSSKPTKFKPGDIWKPESGDYAGNTYMAMSFSDGSGIFNPGVVDNNISGWNKIQDGSLASIVGAGLQVDAAAGTLDLYADSKITLKAKSQLDLASGDIQITGNNSVNIGGKWVNIGANSGINIINSNITNSNISKDSNGKYSGVSKILINSTNGIVMHSSKIELMAADTGNVAALRLNPSEGIYLGSNKEIRFFSTNITNSSGSNVLINSNKIIFGVNEGANGTAISLDKNQLLLAAGNIANANSSSHITEDTAISGVQIQKDYIGMASGSGTSRSLLSIKPTRIIMGTNITETNYTTGNYLLMDNSSVPKFEIGGTGIFKINTPTFKIDNVATGDAKPKLYIADSPYWNSVPSNAPEGSIKATYGIMYREGGDYPGLYIRGNITANSLTIADNGVNKSFNEYIQNLEARIDKEIHTWYGKGTPLYNGTSSTTGKLSHNIVIIGTLKSGQTAPTDWDSTITYSKNNIVLSSNIFYRSKQNNNSNNSVTNTTYWEKITNIDTSGKDDSKAYWFSYDNDNHIGEVYYDVAETQEQAINNDRQNYSETAGQGFRFIKDETTYKWQPIEDAMIASIANKMERIRNGELGLAFDDSGNNYITLNKQEGLIIYGEENDGYISFFNASADRMGFYKRSTQAGVADKGLLYFEDGNLLIAGTLYADEIQVRSNNEDKSFEEYISSLASGLTMNQVRNELKSIFDEAGEILEASATSLEDVNNVTLKQSSLLQEFKERAINAASTTYRGPYHGWKFKKGDIWEKTDVSGDGEDQYNIDYMGKPKVTNPYASTSPKETYIATVNWDEVESIINSKEIAYYGKNQYYYRYYARINKKDANTNRASGSENVLTTTVGWNRISDGRLANITGAKINIDTQAGKIEIKAETSISLLSNGIIDISSGKEVQITGNGAIKLGSNNAIYLNTSNNDNAVTLNSSGVSLKSSAKIEIKSSNGIEVFSGDSNNVSAIKINKTDGIWLGTNQKITLGATGATSGSVINLTPERILFGVSSMRQSTTAASVIDIESDQILLATGLANSTGYSLNGNYTVNGENAEITKYNQITGVQIRKDYIGMAMGSSSESRSIISIRPDKIIIGTGKSKTLGINEDTLSNATNFDSNISGGYIKISQETMTKTIDENNTISYKVPSFEIGSTGIFKVMTPTLKIDNTATGYYFNFYVADKASWSSSDPDANATSGIAYRQHDGLSVRGRIQATSGSIGYGGGYNAWNITSGRLYSGSGATYVALDSGLQGTSKENFAIWAGNSTPGSAPFSVTRGGSIKATAGTIGGWTLKNEILYSEGSDDSDLNYKGTGMSANVTMITAAKKAYNNVIKNHPNELWEEIENDTDKQQYQQLRKENNYSYSCRIPDFSSGSSSTTKYKPGFYAFWAGADDPEEAPFRVTRNGEVFVEKLIVKEDVVNDQGAVISSSMETYNLSGFNSSGGGGNGGTSGGNVSTEVTRVNLNPVKDIILAGKWDTTNKTYTSTVSYLSKPINDKTLNTQVLLVWQPDGATDSNDENTPLWYYSNNSTELNNLTNKKYNIKIYASGNTGIGKGNNLSVYLDEMTMDLSIVWNKAWDSAVVQDSINSKFSNLPPVVTSDTKTAIFKVPISRKDQAGKEIREPVNLTYTLNVTKTGNVSSPVITVTGNANNNGTLGTNKVILKDSTSLTAWKEYGWDDAASNTNFPARYSTSNAANVEASFSLSAPQVTTTITNGVQSKTREKVTREYSIIPKQVSKKDIWANGKLPVYVLENTEGLTNKLIAKLDIDAPTPLNFMTDNAPVGQEVYVESLDKNVSNGNGTTNNPYYITGDTAIIVTKGTWTNGGQSETAYSYLKRAPTALYIRGWKDSSDIVDLKVKIGDNGTYKSLKGQASFPIITYGDKVYIQTLYRSGPSNPDSIIAKSFTVPSFPETSKFRTYALEGATATDVNNESITYTNEKDGYLLDEAKKEAIITITGTWKTGDKNCSGNSYVKAAPTALYKRGFSNGQNSVELGNFTWNELTGQMPTIRTLSISTTGKSSNIEKTKTLSLDTGTWASGEIPIYINDNNNGKKENVAQSKVVLPDPSNFVAWAVAGAEAKDTNGKVYKNDSSSLYYLDGKGANATAAIVVQGHWTIGGKIQYSSSNGTTTSGNNSYIKQAATNLYKKGYADGKEDGEESGRKNVFTSKISGITKVSTNNNTGNNFKAFVDMTATHQYYYIDSDGNTATASFNPSNTNTVKSVDVTSIYKAGWDAAYNKVSTNAFPTTYSTASSYIIVKKLNQDVGADAKSYQYNLSVDNNYVYLKYKQNENTSITVARTTNDVEAIIADANNEEIKTSATNEYKLTLNKAIVYPAKKYENTITRNTGKPFYIDASGRYIAGQNSVNVSMGTWNKGKVEFKPSVGEGTKKTLTLDIDGKNEITTNDNYTYTVKYKDANNNFVSTGLTKTITVNVPTGGGTEIPDLFFVEQGDSQQLSSIELSPGTQRTLAVAYYVDDPNDNEPGYTQELNTITVIAKSASGGGTSGGGTSGGGSRTIKQIYHSKYARNTTLTVAVVYSDNSYELLTSSPDNNEIYFS